MTPFPTRLAQARGHAAAAPANGLIEEQLPFLRQLAGSLIERGEASRHEADDLVQEASFKAFLAFDQFQGASEAEFKGWLSSILRHALANQRRTEDAVKRGGGKAAAGMDPHDLSNLFPDDDPTPSSQAGRVERNQLLHRALDGLPAQYRLAVRLKFFNGLSHQEVGVRLAVTAEAARKLCDRGLEKLRDRLRDLLA